MAKLRFKKLITYLIFFLLAVFLSRLIPAFRSSSNEIFKYPFAFFRLIDREFRALIFFHHNFFENERLKKENALWKQKTYLAEELSLENKRLKSLLAFKQNSPYTLICAAVIARDPSGWSSLIIIDKGRRHGLRPALAVITEKGLVGKVVEVGNTTSKVMLVADPNLGVSALVQRSRQEGLVSGTLGNSLMMRYLSLDADIKVSDVIITSSLSQIYPKGIVIGRVAEIGTEFSGLSRFAIIKPEVNLFSLEEVLVVVR